MKRTPVLAAAGVLAAALELTGAGSPAFAGGPQYNDKAQLLFPANYREWIFLSSGLGMNYGPLAAKEGEDPNFDNVFVEPSAYRGFLQTGRWPDQTMLVIEVRASQSKGSINKAGHYQGEVQGTEVEVKDEQRFPGKWAFFTHQNGAAVAKLRPTSDQCYSCHAEHGAVDNTFVQFYPTLLSVAKEKGTLK